MNCNQEQDLGKLQSTQSMTKLEIHIVSKIATRKISLTLNNFNHI